MLITISCSYLHKVHMMMLHTWIYHLISNHNKTTWLLINYCHFDWWVLINLEHGSTYHLCVYKKNKSINLRSILSIPIHIIIHINPSLHFFLLICCPNYTKIEINNMHTNLGTLLMATHFLMLHHFYIIILTYFY